MSRRDKPRTEADLRAAFAAKATEAPNAADVLRAVRRAERRPGPRRWLLPATAVLAAAAVAAAIPLMLTGGDSNTKAERGAAQPAAGAGGAKSAPGGATSDQASSRVNQAPATQFATAGSVCRADQVTTHVIVGHQAGALRATLTVTARTATCTLSRVPQVIWDGAVVKAAAEPSTTAGGSAPQRKVTDFGQLPAGATATAVIAATNPCDVGAGDTVTVNWGAGPVTVKATGAVQCVAADSTPGLSVGPFAGLS